MRKTHLLFLCMLPAILAFAFFISQTEKILGVPMGEDFFHVHQYLGNYPPPMASWLLSFIGVFFSRNAASAILAITTMLFIPFVSIEKIAGLKAACVYLYGTIIPVFFLLTGVLPQAIVFDLMLFTFMAPWLFPIFAIMGGLSHSFGAYAIMFSAGVKIWTSWRSLSITPILNLA